jgi:beta-lactamase class A
VLVGTGAAAAAYGATHSRVGGTETAAVAAPAAPAVRPGTGRADSARPEEEVRAAGKGEAEAVDLDAALASVAADADGELSVAVRDTASGATAVFGEGAFDTASIVKVNILAALLLRAQDAGRPLTAQEQSHATAMIRTSDNAATTALWAAIGRAAGLAAANERLGLTGTRGGNGDLWGLTQTTARDQLTLLDAVFGEASPLTRASRAYIRGLMERIAAGQDWGVSAAADTGTGAALKNGWLPRSTTALWNINSIGRVESGGRTYLVAVLSRGNSTQATGIRTVEDAARAAVHAFS